MQFLPPKSPIDIKKQEKGLTSMLNTHAGCIIRQNTPYKQLGKQDAKQGHGYHGQIRNQQSKPIFGKQTKEAQTQQDAFLFITSYYCLNHVQTHKDPK
jgi:hypothetical protein